MVHEHRVGTEVRGDVLALVVEDVGEHHLGAFLHEPARLGLTLTTRGTGDDRDLAVESSHVFPLARIEPIRDFAAAQPSAPASRSAVSLASS